MTDIQELLQKMYKADAIASAVDATRRGFDLTDEERDRLALLGIDSYTLQGEFANEHRTA